MLDKIKDNPRYYSGCYLKKRVGNLDRNGSAPSEQNHSSTVAYLPTSGTGQSIMDHTCELVKRQQEHMKEKKKTDDILHCSVHNYRSKLIGQKGMDDTAARKSLSSYAYTELYQRAAKYARYLTSELETDGSVSVWPAQCEKESGTTVNIKPYERCDCHKRVDYDFQCAHELVADKKFILQKCNDRWMNSYFYYQSYPENSPNNQAFYTDLTAYEEIEMPLVQDDSPVNTYVNDAECSQDQMDTMSTLNISNPKGNISYHDLVKKLGELARTVQYSQAHCTTVLADIDKMIGHYRSRKPFTVNFTTFNGGVLDNSKSNGSAISTEVVPANSKTPTFLGQKKRKMSALEYNRTKGTKTKLPSLPFPEIIDTGVSTINEMNQSQAKTYDSHGFTQLTLSQTSMTSSLPLSSTLSKKESNYLPAKRQRTRACTLCYQRGHGIYKCPKLLNYGSYPLRSGELEVRQSLASNLLDPEYFKSFTRDDDDQREIMKSFPKYRLPGLIIHKRFLISENVVPKLVTKNLCIECTFLVKGGEEDIRFTKLLFSAKDVATYVQKTASNIVVTLLHLV